MRLVTTTADLAFYYADKSVSAPVAGMAKTGFRHIDLSMYGVIYKDSPWITAGDAWKKEIEKAGEIAAADGLDFCQAHSPDGQHFIKGEQRDALITATHRSIEACAMLGIPHTVLHAASVPGGTKEDFDRENIAFFKLFEEDAEKFGVDILVENSAEAWNPEYYLRTGHEMADFVNKAGLPHLFICWDIGHGNVQGCNQYDDITAMGTLLHAVHAQDNFGNSDSHMMPMAGTTNFDMVLRGMIAGGYRGDFTFEGCNTIRYSGLWPNYRRDVSDKDRLSRVPLAVQQKQISVMYDIGEWILNSYGIPVE